MAARCQEARVPRRPHVICFIFLLVWFGLTVPAARADGGGAPGSNGQIPTLQIGVLTGGETAVITVGELPASTQGGRVLVAFSRRYAGRDASAELGPGAVIVPDVRFHPERRIPVVPSRPLSGGYPVRTLSVAVSESLVGETLYVQAFVEDPSAPSGLGWAASTGRTVSIQPPISPVTQVVVYPPWSEVQAGDITVLTAEMRDRNGNLVPTNRGSDLRFDVSTGSGRFGAPSFDAGRVRVSYESSARVENARLVVTENVSGENHQAVSWAYGRPGPPHGTLQLDLSASTLPPDGRTEVTISSEGIRDRSGNLVEDGELFTIASDLGTIVAADEESSLAGVQVKALGASIEFGLRAPSSEGVASVTAASVRGAAQGFVRIAVETSSLPTSIDVTDLMALPSSDFPASGVRDPRTGRIYLFGLSTVQVDPEAPFAERIRTTADGLPVAMDSIGSAWDEERGVALLFGGLPTSGSVPSNEIWEFDPSRPEGLRFQRLNESLPEPLYNVSACYDSDRQAFYLFGGVGSNGRARQSMIEYRRGPNPQFTVESIPELGRYAPLGTCYDSTRNRTYFCGDGSKFVFEYLPGRPEGARVQVVATLPFRAGSPALISTGDGTLSVIGGYYFGLYRRDLITVDPDRPEAQRVEYSGRLPIGTRPGATLFDPDRERIYVFGGRNPFAAADCIYEVHPEGSVRPLGGFPEIMSKPSPVPDPSSSATYLFGNGEGVYVLDRSQPFGEETKLSADSSGLRGSIAARDPRTNVTYVFGGTDTSSYERSNRIFRFDPSRPEGSRFQLLDHRLPSSQEFGAAVWDSVGRCAYLFGGQGARDTHDHILKFDPAQPPSSSVTLLPDRLDRRTARLSAVYHPGLRRIYLAGDGSDAIKEFDPEGPAGGRLRTAGVFPNSLLDVSSIYDRDRQVLYFIGGLLTASFSSREIFAFQPQLGEIRSPVFVSEMEFGKSGAAAVEDPATGEILLIGGISVLVRESIQILRPGGGD